MTENSVVYQDLFDTKLMGALVPAPSTVIRKFRELYEESPKAATNYYYKLSCDTNYIRRDRIKRDVNALFANGRLQPNIYPADR